MARFGPFGRTYDRRMGATLRVDPARLRTAAALEAEVGSYVSGLRTGQSMTSAGDGVAGLCSGDACRFAGAVFDAATATVHQELAAHSTNLAAAADRYHHTDEELGGRFTKIADER